MKNNIIRSQNLLPIWFNTLNVQWIIIGGSLTACERIKLLLHYSNQVSITIIAEEVTGEIKELASLHRNLTIIERGHIVSDFEPAHMLIIATGNKILDEKIQAEAKQQNRLAYVADDVHLSDFILSKTAFPVSVNNHSKSTSTYKLQQTTEQSWRRITSKLILVFLLMVLGHIIISSLPLPSMAETWEGIRPYFNYQFLFFILAGFLAQMVDGTLGMGYGVTSATCLMTFGISPVSVSAAIHTSEIFTTATSGYSHYKFKNVNKKMFKHLVVPGCIGAVLGAAMLVFLGEKYGKWLLPVIAVYAFFLGLKILFKAFGEHPKNKKIKYLGWLAGAGGFLDSFGGGGWGPIVTSSLIAKGRSPRYTIGSVNLAEFFITLASALTFFISVGINHWNIVLGLLIGGATASPLAASLAGKLPRKTMMIAVGIMILAWCSRMIIKSFF